MIWKKAAVLIASITLLLPAPLSFAKEYRAPVHVIAEHSVDIGSMKPGDQVVTTLHMTARADVDFMSAYVTGKGIKMEYLTGETGFYDVAVGQTVDTTIRITLLEAPGDMSVEYTADYNSGGKSRSDFGVLSVCCFGGGQAKP